MLHSFDFCVCLFFHFRMFSKLRFLENCNVFLGFHKEFLVCLIFSWHVYNGFLDFQWYVACFPFFCVSYVFVSMIMDRSLRFHLNLDCSIFVLAISQTLKGPYRYHCCISATIATCVLA